MKITGISHFNAKKKKNMQEQEDIIHENFQSVTTVFLCNEKNVCMLIHIYIYIYAYSHVSKIRPIVLARTSFSES